MENQTRGNTCNPRGRKWVFTLNNYTEDEYNLLKNYCTQKTHYIIGREIGENNETPHLQGYISHKNPLDFKSIKNICARLHLEKAKGNDDENYLYCSKEGNFETNMLPPLKTRLLSLYENITWKDWQNEVLEIINTKPDPRKIYCYVDIEGNSGKSFLCKYIDLIYDVIIAEGKKEDIFHQINQLMTEKKEPYIVIVDVPRSQSNYINYTAIEKVKNGHLYSGKYEGGKCIFETPHVFIFCNQLPNLHELSADRWVIKHI